MHNRRIIMARFFRWVDEKLCFLGKQLNIPTGLVFFAIIGVFLDGLLPFLNNLWSLLSLLFLFADVMFGLMGRSPCIGIGIGVVIILSGVVVPAFGLIHKNGPLDFVTLIYVAARSLVFLSLMLEQTRREWLSHLLAGVAYACLTFGILISNFSHLPLDYAFVLFAVLFLFVLFAVLYGSTSDKTD